MKDRLIDAFLAAFIAAILALPLAGARTVDGAEGLAVEWHVIDVAVAAGLIFLGRLALGLVTDGFGMMIAPVAVLCGIAAIYLPMPSRFLSVVAVAGSFLVAARAVFVLVRAKLHLQPQVAPIWNRFLARSFPWLGPVMLVLAVILPFTPLASRYSMDVAIMVLTYIMLAWGLNITVGFAGLLDLGYAGFYALGAYSYALLAQYAGIGFWTALPIAGLIAACTGLLLGFPVLRLRGDYFAIVTLGFGEIVRLVLINWTSLTGGPNGISGVPRPSLFGLDFSREPAAGQQAFSDFFHIDFDPMQRVIYLYYLILALALIVGWLGVRLRRLPIGRAWEAFREDEIACASLGINRTKIKLAAYSLGATVAGLAGAFFATRQGFISPESFTFTESATILAVVILGGVGSPLGTVFAAVFIIGMPELFREFEQYRMLAFGAGMVLIMIWRPEGLMAMREPTAKLAEADMQIPT